MVLLAVHALLFGLGFAEFAPAGGPHAHEGPRHVAIDAVHHSQPTHFDASSVRVEWSCEICLSQSRQAERATALAQTPYPPPATTRGTASAPSIPTRPQTRLDSSRAPPLAL